MRVIGARVNAKLEAHMLPAKGVLREHSVYCPLQHALGILLKQARVRCETLVTHVPGVLEILLLLGLASRDDNLGGVDNDYVVARIHMWSKHGLVLSAENASDFGR